jgi:hypothetical protein
LFRNFIGDALIIGSPAAGSLILFETPGNGATHAIHLPNSGIQVSGTGDLVFDLTPDCGTTVLYPDIFVYQTLWDYLRGYDAVLSSVRYRQAGR